ncbi:MAG TPA: hypothetical protein VMW41_04140 [Candidatus Bathyarchaeia archaeon]|nr:hypothetical protein [Candidatus Bathyarchaeia archaeon]
MGKKRKTRQEKIIFQLKRQLVQQETQESGLGLKPIARQEAVSSAQPKENEKADHNKNKDKSVFFYNPGLVKKDLLKSLFLTIVVISLEVVLYLKLK